MSALPDAMRALYAFMSPRRRRHLAATAVLVVIGAVAELVTIGAVVPFLAALTDRGDAWGLTPGAAVAILGAAAVFAAAARLALVRASQGFALALAHELALAIFGRMLRRPYSEYGAGHSSELLAGFEKVQVIANRVLLPLVRGVVATVMALCIVVLLFVIDPAAAAITSLAFGGIYAGVSLFARPRLRGSSRALATLTTARTRAVQEALGAIRDILLGRSQEIFEDEFRRLSLRQRDAQAANLWLGMAPRYVVEAAAIMVIALLALYMSARPGGVEEALPTLGALALGGQRLLPLVQQAYLSWSQSLGNLHALADVMALVGPGDAGAAVPEEGRPGPRVPFEREIAFDDVSFAYRDGEPVLRGVRLEIPKGARVGIAGATGSGKSTLVDLLLGLLEPTSGALRVDGRAIRGAELRAGWQRRIGHVPQGLHIVDTTIARNIAFGVADDELDLERVERAAQRAQLDGLIARHPDGYDARVGERGAMLSGGERQRIGLARALYKDADVLVLDEATDGLDATTEAAVLEAIEGLGRSVTVVIVAHRPAVLALCDTVVRLEDGRLQAGGVTV